MTYRYVAKGSGEVIGGNEFLQYTDFASFIDKYGLKKYKLDLTVRSANITNSSNIMVYFQNGNDSRYSFSRNLTVKEQDADYSVEFTPPSANVSIEKSMLAFYGTYGTGNKPIVSNVRFYLTE